MENKEQGDEAEVNSFHQPRCTWLNSTLYISSCDPLLWLNICGVSLAAIEVW